MKKNIKILVAYHKPSILLKNDNLVPIHLGRELSSKASKDGAYKPEDLEWMHRNMIGDNTGDNISLLNREFCELTAIYWAWKNYEQLGNPDYIGLMHYRRHFIFNQAFIGDKKTDFCNMIRSDYMQEDYLEELGYYNQIFDYTDSKTCVICSNHHDISPYSYHKNLSFLDQQNYEKGISFAKQQSSKLRKYIEKYLNGKTHCWSNMFILPQKVFFEYCQWMFDILQKFHKEVKLEHESFSEQRFMGYLAESLSGAYWEYLADNGYKIKSLPISFIEQPELEEELLPAFEDNNISICFSTDKNYIPYLSTAIQSIIENTSNKYNYDIVILENGIEKYQKHKILTQIHEYKNISIRFKNINYLLSKYGELINSSMAWYTPAIYYRYFVQDVFKNYKKVLYLDCDISLLKDIAILYNTDLEGHAIGAVIDTERHRWLKGPDKEKTIKFDASFGCNNSYLYFNSGVCLFNIPKLKDINFMERCLKLTAEKIKNSWVGDQDIINGICYNDVKYITTDWNFMWIVNIQIKNWETEIDAEAAINYKNAMSNISLIHYCDKFKPWSFPNFEYANIWWKYARNTPFYEEIITRLPPKIDTNKKCDKKPFSIDKNVYKLFNFIPLLKVRKSPFKSKYLLFSFIPIFSWKLKKEGTVVIIKIFKMQVFKSKCKNNKIKYYILGIPFLRVDKK